MRFRWKAALAAAVLAASIGTANAQKTLKAVMHSDVKIIDPIWTTAYISRNAGYMLYDTLFAMDEKGDVKPQMVEKYTESPDKLTYVLTLRDGLAWHDGAPVTSDDCIASIRRWAARDPLGQKLMSFVDSMTANDPKTFTIKLKSPTGLVLFGLGKPSSNVPFMMPKRVAETDPNTQISDFTGSGPFILKRDEWKPGDKIVFVRNDKYKPRAEPPSGLAGGKVVKLDRVEWLAISDAQQAANALLAGEIDYFEQPPIDLLPLLKGDSGIKLVDYNPLGLQYTMRLNHLQKPFDNPKVRQALWYALNQKDFLDATIGNPDYYKVCKAMFVCGTPLASDKGMDGLLESNFTKAKELLKEANYDGTLIVLLQSTDLQVLTNLAPVAKSLMEKAGFNVDMQSMDWQTVVARRAKKDPASAGGWHGMLTSWVSADILNPVMTSFVNAGCDQANFGWPCDAEMERL
ncbi:MAG: ABC transporter substrate-binding protein, partial [Alphaproteobacteria bacterium]|nr:ABC transporter substrate-binding protein [Alphaproteobacteria bacterium]